MFASAARQRKPHAVCVRAGLTGIDITRASNSLVTTSLGDRARARLRPDSNDQYVEVTADFRHYIDDPHVDPDFTRKMAYTAPGRTPSSPS